MLSLLCMWSVLQAVPAKRGFHTLTQSDGTTITVQMVGDEFHHSFVTQDGLTVALSEDGNFYYRTASGISQQQAHDARDRDAAELSYVASNRDQMTMSAIEPQRAKVRRAAARPRKVGSTQVPTSGSPRVPIILVNFADKAMCNTKAQFVTQYMTGATSARQYFVDQSNGIYQPQYDVYGIYTLSRDRAYYGGSDYNGNDDLTATMVGEAIDKAGNDIDWSQYDNDGDGQADVCIVVYAGVGQAQAPYTVPQAIWPCQWSLSSGEYYNDGTGARTRNGVTIDRFAVFNEIYGADDNGTTMDGVGTFCHEFSHCLGLPDFYETNTWTIGYYGMSTWSLMDYGCYNNDGFTPVGYSAYEKNFMGWLDYITPVEGTQYTLAAMNQKSAATDQAIKITSHLNSNEYFIMENRRKQGWDQYIQDEGLLITHFTYVPDRWAANSVNNESIQLATVVHADNSDYMDDDNADLYGESNHEFTKDSSPASKLNMMANGSLANYTGVAGTLDKPVTEININSDGTVSLWYVKGSSAGPQLDAPVLGAATNVDMFSFDIAWTHTASTAVTYTLNVSKTDGTTVMERAGITAKQFSVTGLEASTAYVVKVKAVPAAGTDASESAWSNTQTVTTTANTLPTLATPVITATEVTSSSFTVSWTAIENATYSIVVTNHYGSIVAEEELLTTNSYSLSYLTMGETYTVKVKAVPVDATTANESAWGETTVTTVIESSMSVDVTNINITTVEGTEGRSSFQIDGVYLDENVDGTITLNDPNGVFRLSKTRVSGYSINNGAVVNVYFTPTVAGTYQATATVNFPGQSPIVVNINGTATISKQNPVMNEPELVQPTSFRAAWTAVPNVKSYTLYIDEKAQGAELILHEDCTDMTKTSTSNIGNYMDRYMDNTGWTGKYVYLENGALRLNDRTYYPGWITSPELDLSGSGGFVTVKINAKAYSTSDRNVYITVKSGNNSQQIDLTDNAADYTAVLPCEAATGQKITIEARNANQKRALLYDIKIYSGDATQASNAPARVVAETGDSTHRVITGITANNYVVKDLKRYGTFNYKVQAIYTDDTLSEMSNTMTVTLADGDQLVGDVTGDGVVDVSDVNAVINIILGNKTQADYPGNANVVGNDDTIDVSDVNAIINIILKQ
ncbi:MAG: M6 family metalloprotease domain-containing protein [Muribaculaceae bacterium]|nr:M6 family metalloprotease domain-containing protein [Muribaculaceae bacterium]